MARYHHIELSEKNTYRISRYNYLGGYILCIILIIVSVLLYYMITIQPAYLATAFLVVLCVVILELRQYGRKIVLEVHSVVFKKGIISSKSVRVPYHSISNIKTHQSLIQRAFGCGDLEIITPGSTVHQKFV